MANHRFASSSCRTLYLNKYLLVLRLVVFFCLWRCRLVSFHICKASRRSSKFCLPVADLHLSSFFLPRPPPRALVFPVLPPRLLPPRLLSNSCLPRHIHLHLLVMSSDLCVAENWPKKKSRKSQRESDLFVLLSSLLQYFLCFIALSSSSSRGFPPLCVQGAPTASREKDRLFSERPTDTSLITSGLDSCGCLRRAPGRDTGTVAPRSWQKHLKNFKSLHSLRRLLDTHSFGIILCFASIISDAKCYKYPDMIEHSLNNSVTILDAIRFMLQ